MAGLPGTSITRRSQPTVPGVPTDTGQTFVVGFAEKGAANTATRIDDLTAYETIFGESLSGVATTAHSAVELLFGEGAGTVYFSRVVGPTPVVATVTLEDAGTADVLRIDAVSPGAWGNDLSVDVDVDGTDFTLTIYLDDVQVEQFADLADNAAAVAALATSDYVRAVQLGANDPAATGSAQDLTSGTDDNGNATDTEWAAALAAFDIELGPGQVIAPGRTTATAHAQLLAHAKDNNRTALLDAANGASKSTLIAQGATTAALTDARYGGTFATWVNIGQRVAGVDRPVPGSVFAAGVIARSDQVNDAGVWPIGDKGAGRAMPGNGMAAYATSATSEFSAADREDLTNAGINLTLDDASGLRLYGFRSASTDEAWSNLGHQRLFMSIQAQAERIAEGFVGERITADTVSRWHQALEGMLYPLYTSGALFGGFTAPSWDQSFRVVTAAPVNTDATAEARELNAELYIRMSESAELVAVIATKVPVTSPVAA